MKDKKAPTPPIKESDDIFWAGKIMKVKDKYFLFAARPASIQRIDLLGRAFFKYLGAGTINLPYQSDNSAYFFSRPRFARFSLNLYRKLCSPQIVASHLKKYKLWRSRLLKLKNKADNLQNGGALLRLFKEYRRTLSQFAYFFITPFSVDDYIFPIVQSQLRRKLKNPESIVEAITVPTMVFGYQKYQAELIHSKTKADYQRLARRYAWVREYSYQEKLLDEVMARQDRAALNSPGVISGILEVNKNVRRSQLSLRLALERISDRKLRTRAFLVSQYINIKTDRIETYKIFQAGFRSFFFKLLEIARRQEPVAEYRHMIAMTDKEIIRLLSGKGMPDLATLNKRAGGRFVSFYDHGKINFVYNEALVETIRSEFLSAGKRELIKGLGVSPGQVRGKVRLILSQKDFSRFKPGEVLVCNFTTPDYVSIMSRALAIITDDGGITCHAAIIARELKKPCLVGTKIATRVLKDGDEIELDTGRGEVAIISQTA